MHETEPISKEPNYRMIRVGIPVLALVGAATTAVFLDSSRWPKKKRPPRGGLSEIRSGVLIRLREQQRRKTVDSQLYLFKCSGHPLESGRVFCRLYDGRPMRGISCSFKYKKR